MRKMLTVALSSALALCAFGSANAAEPYKFSGTVNITVPFKAGSNTDRQIRFLQPYLEKHLDAKTVIINKGGASGVIGVTAYLKDKKNGSSILFSLPTPTVYKPSTGATPYTAADLIPVSQVTASPFYLAVSAENTLFKDGREVISYIKDNPGKFSYANAGNGGIAHLAFASFLNGEGLNALSVPFTGGTAECYTAVMGGHVMSHIVSETELVGRKDYRAVINLGSKSTTKGFENIPTLEDLGYKGYVTDTFAGFYYMKGVDQEAVAALDEAVKATIEDPKFLKAAASSNFVRRYAGYADFSAKVSDTVKVITPVLKALTK